MTLRVSPDMAKLVDSKAAVFEAEFFSCGEVQINDEIFALKWVCGSIRMIMVMVYLYILTSTYIYLYLHLYIISIPS